MLFSKGEDVFQSIRELRGGNDCTPGKSVLLPNDPSCNAAAGGNRLEHSEKCYPSAKRISVQANIGNRHLQLEHLVPIELCWRWRSAAFSLMYLPILSRHFGTQKRTARSVQQKGRDRPAGPWGRCAGEPFLRRWSSPRFIRHSGLADTAHRTDCRVEPLFNECWFNQR
jgi:hypothetical protein